MVGKGDFVGVGGYGIGGTEGRHCWWSRWSVVGEWSERGTKGCGAVERTKLSDIEEGSKV